MRALTDKWNLRLLLRDWLNKPSCAELARPLPQEQIVTAVAKDVAAGPVWRAYEANFAPAVDLHSGRVVGLRKVSGSANAGSWKPSR
jgi:hypothetical protein